MFVSVTLVLGYSALRIINRSYLDPILPSPFGLAGYRDCGIQPEKVFNDVHFLSNGEVSIQLTWRLFLLATSLFIQPHGFGWS